MKIVLEGASNARDLCDVATPLGRIEKNRLVRSGQLSRLTQSDAEILRSLGLKRVVDLRTSAEMQNAPDRQIEGVEFVNISVLSATTFGITYEKSSGAEIAKMLQEGYARMRERGETYGEHMHLLYRKFVESPHSRDAYGKFLRLLAEQPTEGVTLWHCSAGKDRVGTCTALLLHCLGANYEQILKDYMLTNEQSRESNMSILNKVRNFVSERDFAMIDKMLCVDETYLEDFFGEIDSRFSTVENFLTDCGVTARHIDLLRQNYLR